MSKFDDKTLEQLKEVYETITGTLDQRRDYTIKTSGADGDTYTYDRETYLQFGLEVAQEELGAILDDIQERVDRKKSFNTVK
jgi:hypothetical protein